MKPALEIVGLTRRYGNQVAVDHASIAVDTGEFVSLLGPSGCGKTTILRMVAGLIEPDDGQILINGADRTWHPPEKRDIGLVFQSYALFPHMNVFENVAFGLRRRRVAEADLTQRVGEALELVRLAGLERRLPRELSGGQQQRVALARAIAPRPALLLLDEPLSNLDAKLRDVMRIELRLLQRKLGISTVFVTHDQEEALTMSDRICVMNAGRVQQIGSPREVYEHPQTPFVAEFFGRSNPLDGVVRDVGAQAAVDVDGLGSIRVAKLPDGAGVGDKVRLTVRRESLQLSFEPHPDPANCYAGRLMLSSFAGNTLVHLIRLESGAELTAEMRASRNSEIPARDSPVWVGIAADDVIAMPL